MKIKLYFTFLCIGASVLKAQAQDNNNLTPKKWTLDLGGSVGMFIPFDQLKGGKKLVGSNAMTSLQLNYNEDYFAKLQFGQTTVNYKSKSAFSGLNSSIDTKANSTNLGLSIGYQHSFGRWQPFILAGAGASFIDIPTVSFDSKAQTVNYTTLSSTYTYINAGAGINYKISRSFLIFLEGQASTIPNLPKKSENHLSGVSVLIGIKAPL